MAVSTPCPNCPAVFIGGPCHPDRRLCDRPDWDSAWNRRQSTTDAARPSVAESLDLTRKMRACPYRSTQGCGCSGARCSLRGGATVSHIECFACIQRYPE